MFLTKTKYSLRDSLRQIFRHKLLSFLTILTIAITLTLLSVASLVAINSYYASQDIEDQLRIVAFLKQPSDPADNTKLLEKLEKTDHVESVKYVSKEEALKSLSSEMKNTDLDLEETLNGDNPLPDSFQITVDKAENIEGLAKSIANEKIVDSVNYGQDLVDNVMSLNRSALVIGGVIILLMVLATLFLINITIQLTVNSRKHEIHIMKLVGAKNSFIRMPFFIEGVILGALGSALAGLFVYWGYENIYSYISANLPFLPLFNNNYLMILLLVGNVIVGVFLGAVGSSFAVRKHLKI
ncbi:MAG: permease-like cell division protein FtsX [Peptococcaceae bacterium]|nr:permease-like cell division protein FtsX [Peptococcaceae bacterium]